MRAAGSRLANRVCRRRALQRVARCCMFGREYESSQGSVDSLRTNIVSEYSNNTSLPTLYMTDDEILTHDQEGMRREVIQYFTEHENKQAIVYYTIPEHGYVGPKGEVLYDDSYKHKKYMLNFDMEGVKIPSVDFAEFPHNSEYAGGFPSWDAVNNNKLQQELQKLAVTNNWSTPEIITGTLYQEDQNAKITQLANITQDENLYLEQYMKSQRLLSQMNEKERIERQQKFIDIMSRLHPPRGALVSYYVKAVFGVPSLKELAARGISGTAKQLKKKGYPQEIVQVVDAQSKRPRTGDDNKYRSHSPLRATGMVYRTHP